MRRIVSRPGDQHGISMFVVMVMVLLSSLMVLWASRTALFNEAVTGNDADYQRALEAAQALARDAALDIRGERADGSPCASVVSATGCRIWTANFDITDANMRFPENKDEVQDLLALLANAKTPCAAGICAPDKLKPAFWSDPSELKLAKAMAARYGNHTGADISAVGNKLLTPGNDRAWYWIEMLPYTAGLAIKYGGGTALDLAPPDERPYFYRVTAVAQGNKSSTVAVVQTVLFWKSPE